MLLWISHRPVHSPIHPQDQSVLSEGEFVFTAASPVLSRSHLGPREFFAIEFGLSTDIADEGGPPWQDYRGPPGSHACVTILVTRCKAAGQVGSLKGSPSWENFGPPDGKFKTWGFSTAFR